MTANVIKGDFGRTASTEPEIETGAEVRVDGADTEQQGPKVVQTHRPEDPEYPIMGDASVFHHPVAKAIHEKKLTPDAATGAIREHAARLG